jgi:hemerythrin-like domain-containing protein
MPDAAEILMQQHREVEAMFERFNTEGDPSIAMTICEEIDRHATLEEQLVYPELDRRVDHSMAREARQEHDEARRLISEITKADAASDEFVELVQRLEQAIQHHVAEEEHEVFPKMREELGRDRMAQLGGELREAMSAAPASAPGGRDVLDLTKEELYEKAKQAGIEGRSKMSKAELARAVRAKA